MQQQQPPFQQKELFCRHCEDTAWLHSSNSYADIMHTEQKAQLEAHITEIEKGPELPGFTRWCKACKKNSMISHKYMHTLSARVHQIPNRNIPGAFEYYSSMCFTAGRTREFVDFVSKE